MASLPNFEQSTLVPQQAITEHQSTVGAAQGPDVGQPVETFFARLRGDDREAGSVPRKTLVFIGTAVLGVTVGLMGAKAPSHLPHIPGIPRVVSQPPSVSVQGEATLKGILVDDDVSLGGGVGYTYASVGRKDAGIGKCWELFGHGINPTCVRQNGLAVFGAPPEGQDPPKGFKKDDDGTYHYTADPELHLVVPGADLYFYLGWTCKNGVEGCSDTTPPKTAADDDNVTYYPITYVVTNNAKREFEGQPADSSHMNKTAAVGAIGKDVDMSSFSDVAATIAEENFINACTTKVEDTAKADIQLETYDTLSGVGSFLQSAGEATNDPAKIAVGQWVLRVASIKADVIFGTSQSSIRPDTDSVTANKALENTPPFVVQSDPAAAPRHELPADFTPLTGNNLQIPPVFEETKETIAKANDMNPNDVIWDVKPTCQVNAKTQHAIEQIQQLEATPPGEITGLPPAVEWSPNNTTLDAQAGTGQ